MAPLFRLYHGKKNGARKAGREMGRSGGREVIAGAAQVEAGRQELDYCCCGGNGEGKRPSSKMVN